MSPKARKKKARKKMKIEDRRLDHVFTFGDLMSGDAFEFNGKVYMKIQLGKTEDGIIRSNMDYRAVKLTNGTIHEFHSSRDVRKLNVKLVIEDGEDEVTDE